jgi:hypothetical protein
MVFPRGIRARFFGAIFLASILGGFLLSWVFTPPATAQFTPSVTVPARYRAGQQLYLESCSGCHVPIPASVLPVQAWKHLLENPDSHYGIRLPNPLGLTRYLMWEYLSYSSRAVGAEAAVPLFIERSPYFKALHPRVPLPSRLDHTTCVSCHPRAANYDYRTLTPAWEDAP